jgi:hypothetical protein
MDRPDSLIQVGDIVAVELYGDYALYDVTVVSLPCLETGQCWVFFYKPESKIFYVNDFQMIWREPPKPTLVKS